jgi:hypothetical protein
MQFSFQFVHYFVPHNRTMNIIMETLFTIKQKNILYNTEKKLIIYPQTATKRERESVVFYEK